MPYKNQEEAKAYRKAYRQKNAAKIKKYMKAYVAANAAKLKDYLREYRKNYDKENASQIKERQKRWRAVVRQLQTSIKLHYGCLNPDCKWHGEYEACCLDFHHVNSNKKKSLACCKWCIATAVKEINKCTVLCSNCHRLVTAKKLSDKHFEKCRVDPQGTVFPWPGRKRTI